MKRLCVFSFITIALDCIVQYVIMRNIAARKSTIILSR